MSEQTTQKNLFSSLKDKLKKDRNFHTNFYTYVIVLVAFVIVEILNMTGILSSHLRGLLVPVCTYSMLAISLNLTVGILGELSLGHAGFMCSGAFVGAVISICLNRVIPYAWLCMVIALVAGFATAAILGFLIGLPVLRLKGDYLAIVTLAFCEIIKNVVNILYFGYDENGYHFSTDVVKFNISENGTTIIKGAQGITGTPLLAKFTKDSGFLIGTLLVLFTVFIVTNLVNSRDGRAIMSIRDNEIAAESVGINITKYKLMAFTISAALAGMAGAFYAHNYTNLKASTNNLGYNMSIMILVFVVLGGIGNIRGSLIAATIMTLLPEILRFMSSYRMLVYAIVMIVMMLFTWSPKAIEWKEKIWNKIKPRLMAVLRKKEKAAAQSPEKEAK